MIPTSTSTAVRQWLHDQCAAALTPDPLSPTSSLLVCFDEPGPNEPDDIVSIGNVSRAFEAGAFVGGGGQFYLNERYTVTIVIDVFRGGDDAQSTYARAQLLTDTVVNLIRSDLTLGGNVLRGVPVQHEMTGEWDEAHMGRHATSTLEVSCFAQL